MAELGLFGANLPEEFGCAGLNNVAYGLIMQELERGDSGVRSFRLGAGCTRDVPHYAFGSDEQKRRYLPGMAAGEIIGCFGLTEPDFGSNPAGMVTTARERPDGSYVLNGSKMWITNGSTAQIAIVWAKTGTESVRSADSSCRLFTGILGAGSKGQAVASSIGHERARVPGRAGSQVAVAAAFGWSQVPLMCLTQARYGIAWGALGAAMACFEEATAYANTRVMFGRAIGGFQLQQARLADMLTEIVKGQTLVLHWPAQGRRIGHAAAGLPGQAQQRQYRHRHRSRSASAVGRQRDSGRVCVMRHMANLESVYTYEGTHDIHTLAARPGHYRAERF